MCNIMMKKGFSIVEVAISLTIIGMLVSFVIAGQNIKDNLELSNVIDDISEIKTAVADFQSANGSYPGDMYNAEASFGVDNTDNGNGDGDLGTSEGTGTNDNETLLFWQHLALAGLISGSYDGATDGKGGRMETPMKHGLYGVVKASAASDMYITVSKASLEGLFSTKQAYDYDLKYDDGDPEAGTVRAVDGTSDTGNCIDTGAYKLTNNSGTPCVMYFYIE